METSAATTVTTTTATTATTVRTVATAVATTASATASTNRPAVSAGRVRASTSGSRRAGGVPRPYPAPQGRIPKVREQRPPEVELAELQKKLKEIKAAVQSTKDRTAHMTHILDKLLRELP